MWWAPACCCSTSDGGKEEPRIEDVQCVVPEAPVSADQGDAAAAPPPAPPQAVKKAAPSSRTGGGKAKPHVPLGPDAVVACDLADNEQDILTASPRLRKEDAELNCFMAEIRQYPLDRSKKQVGIRFDILSAYPMFVSHVLMSDPPTSVRVYNESAPADRQIRPGDFVKQINGMTTPEDMNSEVLVAPELEVLIQRPLHFNRKIDKQGRSFGLELNHHPGGTSLLIEGINDGAVRSCAPDIKVGDRIIRVDGCQGSEQALLAALKESEAPVLGLVRAG